MRLAIEHVYDALYGIGLVLKSLEIEFHINHRLEDFNPGVWAIDFKNLTDID